jgi:branched-chain amino acid transport system ATP-binding protein
LEAKTNHALLAVKDLCAGYGPITVLKGVYLEVHPGEIVALIGANGAGKSTLLRTISGVIKPAQGSVEFVGEPIQRLREDKIVQRGIVQVQEGRGILSRMTVLENLELGAFTRADYEGISADLNRVFEKFPILRQRQHQLGGTLSGGEQQMLAIGRALMARPKLLLMDEPSLGLAPFLVREIFRIIMDLKQEGRTILLVEQNARKALQCADRAYVMETGRIVLEGRGEELLHSPEVQQAYLGGRTLS